MSTIGTSATLMASALAAVVVTASPAVAAVEHTITPFELHLDAQPQLTEVCGYPVAFDLSGSWSVVTFTDAQGEVTREIRNYRFAALLTANGVTVRGWSNGPEITEWHPDGTATRSVMGVVGRHLPRGGNVLQHAGRMVVELDASGDPWATRSCRESSTVPSWSARRSRDEPGSPRRSSTSSAGHLCAGSAWRSYGEVMRMFAALVPPEGALEDLGGFLAPRQETEGGFRWTAPEQWHVTLAFMPQVPERALEDLLARLERAARRRNPFSVSIAGGGAFPNAGRAKVLYAGLDVGDAEELRRLATGARAAANKAGAEVEGGARFHPHVTLARIGRPLDVTRWIRVLDAYRGPTWDATEVSLVESHLGEGPRRRPRYVVIESFPLLPGGRSVGS